MAMFNSFLYVYQRVYRNGGFGREHLGKWWGDFRLMSQVVSPLLTIPFGNQTLKIRVK